MPVRPAVLLALLLLLLAGCAACAWQVDFDHEPDVRLVYVCQF